LGPRWESGEAGRGGVLGGPLQLVRHAIGFLYINADLFRRAGLDPKRRPATWAELRADGQQLTQKTVKVGAFIIRSSSFGAAELIASGGGRTVGLDGRPAFARRRGAWPLLTAPATSMHTVQTGIAQFLGEGAELWGPLTAASTVVCALVVVAFDLAAADHRNVRGIGGTVASGRARADERGTAADRRPAPP